MTARAINTVSHIVFRGSVLSSIKHPTLKQLSQIDLLANLILDYYFPCSNLMVFSGINPSDPAKYILSFFGPIES